MKNNASDQRTKMPRKSCPPAGNNVGVTARSKRALITDLKNKLHTHLQADRDFWQLRFPGGSDHPLVAQWRELAANTERASHAANLAADLVSIYAGLDTDGLVTVATKALNTEPPQAPTLDFTRDIPVAPRRATRTGPVARIDVVRFVDRWFARTL
jgi:hypothetical protein